MLKKWSGKEKGAIMPTELRSGRVRAVYFINLFLLILIAMCCLLPVLWLVVTSFKSVKEIYSTPVTLFPKNFDITKIARVWKKVNFLTYYKNSFILCAGHIGFDIVISGLAGYVLSRLRPRGIKAVQIAIFWTMLVPSTVSNIERREEEILFIKESSSCVKLLLGKLSDKKVNKKLEELYDLLHSSPSKSTNSVKNIEIEISNRISELESLIRIKDITNAIDICENIIALVEERNSNTMTAAGRKR